MKENKNIERLFQEKFKDFEAMPPQDAWSNIEARLENKKKKRRVIPFWFKASGVAAILTISFWLYNQNEFNAFDNKIENNNNSVVESDEKNQNSQEKINNQIDTKSSFESKVKSPDYQDNFINSNEVVTATENLNEKLNNSSLNERIIKNTSSVQQKINTEEKQLVFGSSKSEKVLKDNQNKGLKPESENKELLLVFDEVENDEEKLVENKKGFELNKNNEKDFDNKTDTNLNNLIPEQESDTFNEQLIATTVEEDEKEGNENVVKEETLFVENLNETDIDTLKINEALAELNEVSKDSTQVIVDSNEKEENELEKLLKEKEEGKNADEKEEEKRNRWVVSTNAAPVYFNSFNENASPLDDQFAANGKSYNSSMSYGVGVEYNISKKLAIRSGVNKFQMDYDTNDIYYTTLMNPDVSSAKMTSLHVDRKSTAQNIMLYKKNENLFIDVANFSNEENGSLNQQIGYVEVPLELSYKMLDKKFGIDIIGGMSTLFLQENAVSLKTDEFQMKIGEANNLNNVNFSGNFGLGFRYTFWKSFNANFQPMLKYQFNTFNENSGNFKPYIVGLYTGLSYSF